MGMIPSRLLRFTGISITEAFAFRRNRKLHNSWYVSDNGRTIQLWQGKRNVCAYNVWKKQGNGGKGRWKGWGKGEAEKGKVARWRRCHRLNTPTRDPEGQGVSPAWNAAGTRWRTNSSLSLSLLPCPFLLFSPYHQQPLSLQPHRVLISMNFSPSSLFQETTCSLNDELLLLVLALLSLPLPLPSFAFPPFSCRFSFEFSSHAFLCASLCPFLTDCILTPHPCNCNDGWGDSDCRL